MKKILFIGNSLTGHIFDTFTWMVQSFAEDHFLVEQVWAGGATLEGLMENGRAELALHKDSWDIVVLQEQSQLPALPGKAGQSFLNSVSTLSKKVRQRGAEPVLYETWGHQQGDHMRQGPYQDYETMQQALTDAYQKAATQNNLPVIPVGSTWAKLKINNPEIFARLVQEDCYHPAGLGQFFSSAIFFEKLLGQSLGFIEPKEDLDREDCLFLLKFLKSL